MSIDSSSSTFIQRLGRERLQVISKLGGGASGTVFRARDRETRRMVALKVLRDATPQRVERFRREAEVAASLVHPSIVPVISAGVFEGHFFIAYELIESARTLDQVLPGLELRARVEALRDVARALGHAHARGVVHRDVKPANVLVAADGRALLTDFGLAAAEGQERMTRTGAIVGTPHYMAPEQINGRGAAPTPATDVWALGVLLYEALTGRLPFNAESLLELATQILTAAPERPSQVRPGVSPGLEAVCLRALDADPSRRPAHGDAFAADLDAWLTGSTMSAARPRGRLPRPRTVALVVSALVGAGVLAGSLAYDPRPDLPGGPVVATVDAPAPVATVSPVAPAPEGAVVERDVPPWERTDPDESPVVAACKVDAREGNADAMYLLGGMYDIGSGLPKDEAAALRCFLESARGGNLPAAYSAAEKLLKGEGCPAADLAAALTLFTSAAERGHAGAMRVLGRLHLGRPGVAQDLTEARRWLERAAEESDKDAQFQLALMLARGEGGPVDRRRAVELLEAAAGRVHTLAMRAWGRVLLDGRDAPQDLVAGARWVKRAFDKDSFSAGLLYAELLADGRGVAANPARGRSLWLEVAANLRAAVARSGEPQLMVLLAHVHVADRWTVPDPVASREWLERAAALHDHDARRILARGWDEWDE